MATTTGGTTWIDWANLALGAYSTLKQPEFKNQPLSPEQRQIYQLYINSLMNPALSGLGAKTAASSTEILNGYGNLGWTAPTTFSGQSGYGGSHTPTTPTTVPRGTVPPPNIRATTGGGPGGMGQRVMNRVWDPVGEGGPEFGESIYGWMTRDPGGSLPGAGREAMFPTRGGPNDPNRPSKGGTVVGPNGQEGWLPNSGQSPMQYGTPSDLMGFTDFLRSQGVKDAARIAIGLIGGGLAGGALAAAKAWWDRYQSGRSGQNTPPPSDPNTGLQGKV